MRNTYLKSISIKEKNILYILLEEKDIGTDMAKIMLLNMMD